MMNNYYDPNWINKAILEVQNKPRKNHHFMSIGSYQRNNVPLETKRFLNKEKNRLYAKKELRATTKWLRDKVNWFRSCDINSSSKELELRQIVRELFSGEGIIYNDRYTLNVLELDIYIPSKKIAFEYNGYQHYHFSEKFHKKISKFKLQKRNDNLKSIACKSKKIKLIVIPYWIQDMKSYLLDKLNTDSVLNSSVQMQSV